jgi:hypothetical protein
MAFAWWLGPRVPQKFPKSSRFVRAGIKNTVPMGGQEFSESSVYPKRIPPTPSGGIWLAATMSLTVVRCWVNC